MAGSGKSTVARKLAKKYKTKYYFGGDILKELAREEGYKVTGIDWWDTPEGMKFLSHRKKDLNFDKKVDEILLKMAKRGGVFTSWTLPWIYDKSINIWLNASQKTRAKRMAERDNTKKGILSVVKKRDIHNRKLYKKLYGIELEKDYTPFDLVINTNGMTQEQTIKIIHDFLKCVKKN
jgi:cytidylate kinase